MSSRFVEEQC